LQFSDNVKKDGSSSSTSGYDSSSTSDDDRNTSPKQNVEKDNVAAMDKLDALLGNLQTKAAAKQQPPESNTPTKLKSNLFETAQQLAKKSSAAGKKFSSSDDDVKSTPKPTIAKDNIAAMNKLNLLLGNLKTHRSVASEAIKTPTPLGYRKLKDKQKPPEPEEKPKPTSLLQATQEIGQELGVDTETGLVNKLREYATVSSPGTLPNIFEMISSMKKENGADETDTVPTGWHEKPDQFKGKDQWQPRNQRKQTDPLASHQSRKPYGILGRPARTQNFKHKTIQANKNVRVELFGEAPLNIFDADAIANERILGETWAKLEHRDKYVARAPQNYFEKMAMWTEQGKVWKFPIDNEQGRDVEAAVSFTEHVFLDEHLELWCPPRGPVRNFMDLVCVGLSKNPYLTVQQKREHIEWYKNYFEEKKEVLQRAIVENVKNADSKKIE